MEKIVAPIGVGDHGPAVANLQQAMLTIVDKRHLTPNGLSFGGWLGALDSERPQQLFGPGTLRLLIALLAALQPPGAESVTDSVAEVLNKVLLELHEILPPTPLTPTPVSSPRG